MITTMLLCVFGLVMVYSASFPLAIDMTGSSTHFLRRQLVWFSIGLFLFLFITRISYKKYRKIIPLILFGCFCSLIGVLLFGHSVNGAKRWLALGPFTIQPSEFVKLGMIIYLAHVYSNKQSYINHFVRGVLPPLIVLICMFALIMLQPDLGTGTAILLAGGVIVFLSGARWTHLVTLAILACGVITWLAYQAPYRVQRLIAFREPFEIEAQGSGGYQLIQSYIAIAHGGLTGTGLGQSVQKMSFLPEPHTDFIFAVIAEELGIFGLFFTIAAFAIIAVRGFRIAARCEDTFGRLLAFGLVFNLLSQALFNKAAVTGMMPITGITLPFISYGGSSLLISMISMAILINISKDRRSASHSHT
ncbi:putative lipid II flippase FtsW [Alteribacillus sp. HJP-4]|uniref:putative lipid II flippase FtsW n=1 Tax=Alteribacillus sp. HJP-4 TaxID=2775394 RepID=UPI0035CD2A3E